MQLATAISQLFSAMTAPAATAVPKSMGTSQFDRNVRNSFDAGSSRNRQQQRARPTATTAAGVGYGGGGRGEDSNQHRHLKEQAAARQRTTDEGTARTLRTIREMVDQILRAEENFVYKDISPLGWLPLGVVGILKGSPLAACLRL